ncbi:MAG: hypothetical protein AABX01_03595 [Candidatus Micrarchaeota archaeon]
MDKLMLLSLFGAVLGMLAILAISRGMQPQEMKIDSITAGDIGRIVAIRGKVSGISGRSGSYFFNVCAAKCLRVAIFGNIAKRMAESSTNLADLKNGNVVALEGVVREYKEELTIDLLDYKSLRVQKK